MLKFRVGDVAQLCLYYDQPIVVTDRRNRVLFEGVAQDIWDSTKPNFDEALYRAGVHDIFAESDVITIRIENH